MIKISNLSYHYETPHREKIVALRELSLTVEEGEYVAILGPNGCGKTTLAKHLNGLLIPSEGTVSISGMSTKDPANLWKIRQQVGLVFQNPENQIIATLVEEDVAFGPENLGQSSDEIRKRVDEVLEAVGMSDFALSEPHFLSAGQQQRIAIAGVLAMRPEVLVLDEPTSMLDATGRKEVLRILKVLNSEQKSTIIGITNFTEEALEADRVIIMQSGRIFQEGTPKELLTNPTRLKELGISPLPINQLAVGLTRTGLGLPSTVLTVEEMVKLLCSLN